MADRKLLRQKKDYFREAHDTVRAMSPEAKEFFVGLTNQVCDFAEREQMSPREVAAGVASIMGLLVMTEVGGNPHADEPIEDFIDFSTDAMQVAIATARIIAGWTPKGPN
ncbi:MAG TPA: hypothetical protein VL614_15060 [Acetobacteraceae bacterium]|jgi:hypothetical protein|nr:hypothetical protein [Acetobacteraceae bacterium]